MFDKEPDNIQVATDLPPSMYHLHKEIFACEKSMAIVYILMKII